MKTLLVAAGVLGSAGLAYADTAFQCATPQGNAIVIDFSESHPRYPSILVAGSFQVRFVKGASYFTHVNLNDEVRTYRYDFGGGKNLVLNFLVSYAVIDDTPPAVSGILDRTPFSCVQATVKVDYPMLDRIVNNH